MFFQKRVHMPDDFRMTAYHKFEAIQVPARHESDGFLFQVSQCPGAGDNRTPLLLFNWNHAVIMRQAAGDTMYDVIIKLRNIFGHDLRRFYTYQMLHLVDHAADGGRVFQHAHAVALA